MLRNALFVLSLLLVMGAAARIPAIGDDVAITTPSEKGVVVVYGNITNVTAGGIALNATESYGWYSNSPDEPIGPHKTTLNRDVFIGYGAITFMYWMDKVSLLNNQSL